MISHASPFHIWQETRVRMTLEPESTPFNIKEANLVSPSLSLEQEVPGKRPFIRRRTSSVCGLLSFVRGSQQVHLCKKS